MAKLGSFREAIPSGGRAVFTAYNKKIAEDITAKLAQPERHFEPSEMQQRIFDWVKDPNSYMTYRKEDDKLVGDNAMIEAVAGAGKTTTLVKICKLLNMQVSSATFHSIGLRAWQGAVGRPQVNGDKINDLMEEMDIQRSLRAAVGKLVSLGKQRGIGIEGLGPLKLDYTPAWEEIIDHFDLDEIIPEYLTREQVISAVVRVLRSSIDSADEVIDFEDMIYMPLYAGVAIPQYDWVLVDEYQDTNPTRRELARRMLAPNSRFVGVGDPHQAIYGFTGADNDSMEIGVKLFNCVRLPLTVTYRCPRAVVTHAQQWVSHIQAHPSAPQGVVRTIKQKEFLSVICQPRAATGGIIRLNQGELIGRLNENDAILCRNTRPLIELAFDLIRKKIPCHVEGRDIGQGLISLVKKWKAPRTITQFQDQFEEWAEHERAKFIKRGRKDKLQSLEDKVGTLQVFMYQLEPNDSLYKLIESINSLFKDTDTGKKAATVTLSTVHKSKGREWLRVFLLGRNAYMPSPYAKSEWQKEQEVNLIYVAVTRAMQELIEVRVPVNGELPPEYDEDDEPQGPQEIDLWARRNGFDEPDVRTNGQPTHEARLLPRPAVLEDEWASFREPSGDVDLIKQLSNGLVKKSLEELKMEAFLAQHGVGEKKWRQEYEATFPPKIEESLDITNMSSGWEFDAETRLITWLAEQEQLRMGGMTDLSEEG